MVDIRQEVCGVIVAGTPAPGINGVISAVVIKCLSLDILPIGFLYGFAYLKQGITKYYQPLRIEDVTRVHNRGGSILYTSKEQIRTDEDLENCMRALQHLRVKYLITIGGTETAFSAHKLATAFRDRSLLLNNNNTSSYSQTTSSFSDIRIDDISNYSGILITHVPKTIFNDLPLPSNCFTFGFSTAQEIGCKIVSDLSSDAKAMNRWYIVTIIGAKSGHLTLGIGTASAATICLIPEEFEQKKTTKSRQSTEDKKRKEIQQTVEQLMNYKDLLQQNEIPTSLVESLMDKKSSDDDDELPPDYESIISGETEKEAPKKGMGCIDGCMASPHLKSWFFTLWMIFFFVCYIICSLFIDDVCSCDCFWSSNDYFYDGCIDDDYTTCSGFDLKCGFPCSMTYKLGGGFWGIVAGAYVLYLCEVFCCSSSFKYLRNIHEKETIHRYI